MAKYTIISDVGIAITNVLREYLVPEPIDRMEKIGICEPKDRGEYIVGIHPYDIKEDLSAQKREPIHLPDGTEQDPPSMMELYYMISVSSKAQVEMKSAEESRIIGKIIQVIKDNPIIPPKFLPEESRIDQIPISMIPLEMEEKVKIWTMFGESYKLSVFYLVGPVSIDSEIIRRPEKRVENFIIGTSQKIPRKIVQFETRIKEEDIDDDYTQDYSSENDEEEENMDDDYSMDDDGGDESENESEDSDSDDNNLDLDLDLDLDLGKDSKDEDDSEKSKSDDNDLNLDLDLDLDLDKDSKDEDKDDSEKSKSDDNDLSLDLDLDLDKDSEDEDDSEKSKSDNKNDNDLDLDLDLDLDDKDKKGTKKSDEKDKSIESKSDDEEEKKDSKGDNDLDLDLDNDDKDKDTKESPNEKGNEDSEK